MQSGYNHYRITLNNQIIHDKLAPFCNSTFNNRNTVLTLGNFSTLKKYEKIAIAEGEAEAIRSVYAAIHDGDPSPDLIAIKYLEALGAIADGQATKIFIPAEMSATMGSIGSIAELFQTDNSNVEAAKEEEENTE